MRATTIALAVAALCSTLSFAQTARAATPQGAGDPNSPENQRLRTSINDVHILGNDFWIYNDLAGAIEQAKKTDRPIFVTFRCVPCKKCAGFDAEVAKGSEGVKKLAQEKFVSLRQVEMKGVDLSQFQFDYDLNWAAMFINADGTVYARYGTQSVDGPDAYNSIASLEKTMARVLELHANYQKVKASLAAKRGPDKPYKTGLEMPGMEDKAKLAGETVRQNCIHCHMIHDAEQNQWRKEGTLTMDRLQRYPLPDVIGMHIDPVDGRRIQKVTDGSAVAKVGLAVGDEITHVNGQPITSIADIQWVLHNTPDADASIEVTINHGGASQTKQVALAKGWRKTDIGWRRSRMTLRPSPGFWAAPAGEKEMKALGALAPEGGRPLRVLFIGNQPEGKSAQNAGLKVGDLIVAINGQAMNLTTDSFQTWVRLNCKGGEKLALKVVRDGKQMDIAVPLLE